MTIDIEKIIEEAFEKAFLRLLEQTIQAKVEARIKKAFEGNDYFDGYTLTDEIEELIESVFYRIVEKHIPLEKSVTGFTKRNLTEGEHQ